LRDKLQDQTSTFAASSINKLKLDIDAVSEISNGVDSLIDTFGDYFRQRLSFLKQGTDIRINTLDEEGNSFRQATLARQSSDNDSLFGESDNQGLGFNSSSVFLNINENSSSSPFKRF
jgi:hypothetical protein